MSSVCGNIQSDEGTISQPFFFDARMHILRGGGLIVCVFRHTKSEYLKKRYGSYTQHVTLNLLEIGRYESFLPKMFFWGGGGGGFFLTKWSNEVLWTIYIYIYLKLIQT